MIHTVYSNTYEVLRLVLLNNLDALNPDPAAGVFASTPVLVPSNAVAGDLSREIAREKGIFAGWDFMTPSAWMGFFAKAPLANVVGNEAEWMIWRILREDGPGSFREVPEHRRLRVFLTGKSDEEIYAFSRRVAALFVVYASYRADWVLRWLGTGASVVGDARIWQREEAALRTSEDYLWQVHLWERLAENPLWQGKGFMENFVGNLEKLSRSAGPAETSRTVPLVLEDGRTIRLPGTLHVFMPFVIPPLMLPILKALALSGRDIWFYILNPSAEYWFDSVSRLGDGTGDIHPLLLSDAASMRANIDRLWQFTQEPDTAPLLDDRSEAGLAPRPAREEKFDVARFNEIAQRLSIDGDIAVERQSYYIERRGGTLLKRVQDSLLNNSDDDVVGNDGTLGAEHDDSIRFWNAPTEIRQWEAIADAIESLFAADPDLKPSDIAVLTPDVDRAAPLVDKVFGSIPASRRFAFSIKGLAPIASEELAGGISGLANLMTSRASREDFEAWLALPPVARRFSLTAEDLHVLGDWLRAAGYREGLSDEHLKAHSPDVFAFDTDMCLMRAVERLTLGYTLPEIEGMPLGGILPKTGDETSGFTTVADRPDLLSTLRTLALRLEDCRQMTAGEKPASEWAAWLNVAAKEFFDSPVMLAGLKRSLDELMHELSLAATTDAERQSGIVLSFSLFMKALRAKLDVPAGSGDAGSGVTVCPMEMLRGLPRRIIFIAGLDAGCGFPGEVNREEFDLTAFAPRRGDRDSRRDRRNLFLDCLLAAREKFIVTYVTSSELAEAAVLQPSVVVQEMRDWLLGLVPDAAVREREAGALTEMLPLNSFSAENFSPVPALWHSHDGEVLDAVRAVLSGAQSVNPPAVFDSPVPPATGVPAGWTPDQEGVLELPLPSLVSYSKAPEKWLAREAGIAVLQNAEADADSIWPSQDGLRTWSLNRAVSEAVENGEAGSSLIARRAADPAGGARKLREWLELEPIRDTLNVLSELELLKNTYAPCGTRAVSVPLFNRKVIVTGTIDALYRDPATGEELLLYFSPSRHLKPGPLFDLVMMAAAGSAAGLRLFNPAGNISLPALAQQEALDALEYAVRSFLGGCLSPMSVPPDALYEASLEMVFGRELGSLSEGFGRSLRSDALAAIAAGKCFPELWKAWWDMLGAPALIRVP